MAERIITLALLLGGLVYLFLARQLAFGTLASPKAGFLPIVAGSITVILALILVVSQWRSHKSMKQTKVNWTTFSFIIIGLLFYITSLQIIGFLAATFIFLFYLLKVGDRLGWIIPFVIAAASSTFFYILFERYLAVTLP